LATADKGFQVSLSALYIQV